MVLKNKKVVVTGAAFIGVHLVRRLIEKKVAKITVINLTDRHRANLSSVSDGIHFVTSDLREYATTKKNIKGADVVFHLAADHGGRGYVDLKQGNTASNFLLDGSVFRACLTENIQKVFFASSGCVYPINKQSNPAKKTYLKEDDVIPPYDADNTYGWAKLMGELTLKQYQKDFGLPSAIGRFFTVYGPFASESHAVMGTIAKAFIKQDPFQVWGNGKQVRNWTYVDDIVEGIIKTTENISDATPINLGTSERITVDQMVQMILEAFQFSPKIRHVNMPSGPVNRVADISLALRRIGWKPQHTFAMGLHKTIEWYVNTKNRSYIRKHLSKLLIHD